MLEKLLLNQARHADSESSNTTLQIELPSDKEVVVDGAFNDTVNQYGVYLDEREACNKVRLTASVKLYASNVIFNTVTEITKWEGSDDCIFLNYNPNPVQKTIGKRQGFEWGDDINYAVIDTQISYDGVTERNYTYNCGIDIFNNPILRSNTYISQWYTSDCGDFNTFDERVCDQYKVVKTPHSVFNKNNYKHQYRHTKENTMTFFDSLDRNMVDNGGWIGFYNKSQAKTIGLTSGTTNGYGTDRVINNESTGKFIDLFPGRDRYSLIPHYNQYRRRYENNWEHCITYPSSSTTENIPFINQKLDTLKIGFIDETEKDDDGIYRCTIYCLVKHGLSEDDIINLYKTSEDGEESELVEGNIVVDTVIDDYTFTVYTSDWVCRKWVSVFDKEQCEHYNIKHIIGNKYYVANSKMQAMVDDFRYDFNIPTSKWYYSAEDDKYYEWPNGDDSNAWKEVPDDTEKILESSVNNYLSLDFDKYGTVIGYKYLPYNRFAYWLSTLYTIDPSVYNDICEYFIDNKESFKITATLSEDGTWEVSGTCKPMAISAVTSCQYLSGITYSENYEVIDNAQKVLESGITAYFTNGEYPYEHSAGQFPFVSSHDIDGHGTTLTDSIDFGYNYWDENITEGKTTDIGSKNLSFAKAVDGIQNKYYVRLFSRLPNFEFYNGELTYDNIYSGETGSRPVDTYSKIEYERQSTVTKLGFAKNAYGDEVAQIVYNDDIDIDLIKDNLGRPLTSLYLAFFKTNYGYREWYQRTNSEGGIPNYKSPTAEWSRCFGKLNCGFEYSPYIGDAYNLVNSNDFANVRVMNNIHGVYGLNQVPLGGGSNAHQDISQYIDDDEMFYKEQNWFYGDLCEYSPSECMERSIQWPMHRFNTAQRELRGLSKTPFVQDKFKTVTYSVVGPTQIGENLDANTRNYDYDDEPVSKPEGQIYQPYYEIPIRTFSPTISEFWPDMIGISSISATTEGKSGSYTITTTSQTYYNQGTTPYIFDNELKVSYKCEIVNIIDLNVTKVALLGADSIDVSNPSRYRIFAMRKDIPSYAEHIDGVDSAYRWRAVVQNGFESAEGVIEEYPFVNGCLYINKDINLFVRRQDPFGEYGLSSVTKYFGIPSVTGEKNPVESGTSPNANDAISEAAATC